MTIGHISRAPLGVSFPSGSLTRTGNLRILDLAYKPLRYSGLLCVTEFPVTGGGDSPVTEVGNCHVIQIGNDFMCLRSFSCCFYSNKQAYIFRISINFPFYSDWQHWLAPSCVRLPFLRKFLIGKTSIKHRHCFL